MGINVCTRRCQFERGETTNVSTRETSQRDIWVQLLSISEYRNCPFALSSAPEANRKVNWRLVGERLYRRELAYLPASGPFFGQAFRRDARFLLMTMVL